MKVLHLLDSLNRGGTETLILDIAKHENKPFEMYVASAQGGDLEDEFKNTNVKYIQYTRRYKFDIGNIFFIRRMIISENINIIHTHLWIDALYVYFAKIGLNIKHVHSFHAFDIYNDFKYKLTISFIIKRTNLNLYVSDFLRKDYIEKYKTKVRNEILYNGIDISKFNALSVDIKNELGISESAIVFGMVGNFINEIRDQLTICKALKEILCDVDDFHFIFIGKKSETYPWIFDNCVNYCKENDLLSNVHFIGQRKDVPGILKGIDGIIYATNFDTFGIAVVEGMIQNLPVLVNDFGVMEEITENGSLATLYKSKDLFDLVTKFIHIYNNLDEFKKNALIKKPYVIDKYSITTHIDKLYKQYQNLLK